MLRPAWIRCLTNLQSLGVGPFPSELLRGLSLYEFLPACVPGLRWACPSLSALAMRGRNPLRTASQAPALATPVLFLGRFDMVFGLLAYWLTVDSITAGCVTSFFLVRCHENLLFLSFVPGSLNLLCRRFLGGHLLNVEPCSHKGRQSLPRLKVCDFC